MSSPTINQYQETGNVSTPTKTHDQNDTSYGEEHALNAIAKEVELRLHYQREQNREARQIRQKELEKNAQDDDDNDEPSTPVKSTKSEVNSGIGTNTNSLLFQKFLNGDLDLCSIEHRDLRRLLNELETKYKSSMIINSSLYNEKQTFIYEIDHYKDIIEQINETLNQIKRQCKDKSRDFDIQNRTLIELQQDNDRLKQILMNCQNLIDESEKQKTFNQEQICISDDLNNQQNSSLNHQNETLDEKFKKILTIKRQQYEEIILLKSELDEEKYRSKALKQQIPNSNVLQNQNINVAYDIEQQKQLTKEVIGLQSRLQWLETDNISIQQENKRYEAQLTRYKQQLEDAERVEDELKQERRRLQHDLRMSREELESERVRSHILQRENQRLRLLRKKDLLNNNNDNLIRSGSQSPSQRTNSNDTQSNSPLDDSI